MNMTALIVSDDTDNTERYHRMESSLRTHDIIAELSSFHGQEVGFKLSQLGVQLLVVDTSNSERALGVIAMARELKPRPAIFVCTEARTAEMERDCLGAGAMYVFSREMGESVMVDCIVRIHTMHLAEERHELAFPELVRILRTCRISARQRGYQAIYDCVHLLYRIQGLGMPLTKKVYPSIAKKLDTTPTRLEKNIRDAIKNAWDNGGSETIPAYLGCAPDRPPTNGQLIMAVCQKLRENMAELEQGRELVHI